MAGKRLAGSKNYLWLGTRGAEITTGALTIGKWYKISAKGATTAFPATSIVGDVFYCHEALTLGSGDKALPFTLEKLAFVTNVPNSASKEKYEVTVQTDDVKTYVESDKSEMSGTINGYFITGDDIIKSILKRFRRVVEYATGSITFNETATGTMDFFLGRNETSSVGDVSIFEYLPSTIDSLEMEKPMDGAQTFNFGYTVSGSDRPSMHIRPITT